MKKNVFLGIDTEGKMCCLLYSFLTFDVIKQNLADLEENDFLHDCTNWRGCDRVERTLKIKQIATTGRKVYLPHKLLYAGFDSDMGQIDEWTFEVALIAETKQTPINSQR